MSKHGCTKTLLFALLVSLSTFLPAADPATPEQAAKVFDISKLPLLPKHDDPNQFRVAGLSYQAKASIKEAAEFHMKQILAAKFKELPGGYVTDQTASYVFGRDGYTLSLVVSESGTSGMAFINLINHGNVDLTKLPLPKGAKLLYGGPASAIFTTTDSVEKTTTDVQELLAKAGWTTYGGGKPVYIFRNHGVLLTAMIDSAPAQMGKTSISYSTQLASVELPAPNESQQIQYSDNLTQLYFETTLAEADLVKFYRDSLASAGWEATTDNPIKDGFESFIIFRNTKKDLLNIQLRDIGEGKLRIVLRHQTAAEVAEEELRFKEALDKKKKEEAEEKAGKSKK